MNFKKGDQVHLPTSLDIDGKSYKLREIASQKSQRYKGLYNIQTDLTGIQNPIHNYLQNQNNDFEYFRSLIITYRKCFSGNKGRLSLEKQRDLKEAPHELLDLHDHLMELGNTYVAHADDTLFDQSSIHLVIDNHEKAVGIRVVRMSLVIFDKNQFQIWHQLISFLKNSLSRSLKKLSDSILRDANMSTKNGANFRKKI